MRKNNHILKLFIFKKNLSFNLKIKRQKRKTIQNPKKKEPEQD
jgi:hypothetical protein